VLGCNGYEIVDLGVMVPAQDILARAKEERVDVIGLSGLITPSLDEMCHVARELQRQGFELPLLIGGATTSRVHTSVKIDGCYDRPIVHVLDASRAVGVVRRLLSEDHRDAFVEQNARDHQQLRERRAGQTARIRRVSLEQARANRLVTDWAEHPPVAPLQPGIHVLNGIDLGDLVPTIDWTPFFHTWELKASYPGILEDPRLGEQATTLLHDARQMLEIAAQEGWLQARAVFGFFPAQAVGDDIVIYTDESRSQVRGVLPTLRQQAEKPPGRPNLALCDYLAPLDSGVPDWIGLFVVTAGLGCDERVARFKAEHDDYRAILLQSLADRLAEALAERLHQRVRTELWGTSPEEDLAPEALIDESYQGIRPAPGYPACPDHTLKSTIFELLDAEQAIGVQLTESMAVWPAASVSGLYLAHPQARYFGVGKLQRDQVEAYAARRGWTEAEALRWLGPSLAYEPEGG
ncbi:MAG: vitamin B12 dependent-methionine synthase activation domain-containing protein, partial [Myxococcota bacterium]|nr:vitamin B12 dependent-methionine synthase activation domain-containing protein [Myxococcota bacterium]